MNQLCLLAHTGSGKIVAFQFDDKGFSDGKAAIEEEGDASSRKVDDKTLVRRHLLTSENRSAAKERVRKKRLRARSS